MSDTPSPSGQIDDPALRALLDALPDPHLVISRDTGAPLAANAALTALVGSWAQQAEPLAPCAFSEPADAVRRLVAGDSLTVRLAGTGAEGLALDAAARPLDPDRLVVRLMPALDTTQDAARRTIAALTEKLRRREKDFSDAIKGGVLGVWTYDAVTEAYTLRGEVLSWMGKDPVLDTATREDWAAIIPARDGLRALAEVARILDEGGGGHCDLRIRAPDGERWVRAQARPLRSGLDGRPTALAGALLDITAERAVADALADERQRFAEVFKATPAFLHSVDAQGRTFMVSEAWQARLGYGPDEMIGQLGWAFFLPADRTLIETGVFPEALSTGAVTNIPLTALTRDGERVEVRLSAVLERNADGTPLAVHGAFQEVTDLNAARRSAEAHAAALERSNRELDRFAVVAAHDLMEPLRKIAAFSGLLQHQYSGRLDADAETSLEFLVDAAGRMRGLIDDLLAYWRTSTREMRLDRVNTAALVQSVAESLSDEVEAAGARIEIADLPVVRGDPALLEQLFRHLLLNALKFRQGETVTVRISARAMGGLWRFEVADDGIGFEQRLAEKIFAPFQRLHVREAYPGNGVGLSVCQQAVERHGGQIWAHSAPGEGARFQFTLPGEGRTEPPTPD